MKGIAITSIKLAQSRPISSPNDVYIRQYRPFPLLIAGEIFLFLVIRRNPLPTKQPGNSAQFRPAPDRA